MGWTNWRCRAFASGGCARCAWVVTLGRRFEQPRGMRLRLALERLGPIFVKFGQVLSTRRDLLPLDVADELARLQDRVPPFPAAQASALVEKAFGRRIDALFASFEAEPVASASIAQVHFATLKSGREVAVKVLRPGMPRGHRRRLDAEQYATEPSKHEYNKKNIATYCLTTSCVVRTRTLLCRPFTEKNANTEKTIC